MPYIMQGEQNNNVDYRSVNHDYDYPNGLDLKPGSELHNDLRSKILERARESRNEMSKRFSSWREIDKSLTTYMPLKDKEKTLKEKDSTKPVSIVFPYSYSMLEALLTYLSMAFFQDPMFQFQGIDDDDTIGSIYLSVLSTNPKTLLGFGTWVRIAEGQFLVGFKTGDADFDPVENTGGSKTHTHNVDVANTTSGAPSAVETVDNDLALSTVDVASSTHTHDVDPSSISSGNNSDLPPFYVVYIWKRTA